MRRWLVTGGCGFIGRNLVSRLLSMEGSLVRVIDNLSVGTQEELNAVHPAVEQSAGAELTWNANNPLTLVAGDICDEKVCDNVAAGADVIVHLAGNTGVGPSISDPRRDCLHNVLGTLNYLEACRRHVVPRFIFASSGAVVGNCEPPLHEELPAHPVSPYGASKLAGEAYCSVYKRAFGIGSVALRFGNCYGPLSSHKASVVAKFIREALAGQPWEIYGRGDQTRDFIFVDDIIDAIVLAASADGIGGEVFQIATSAETTVLELAAHLTTILNERGLQPAGVHHASPRQGDVRRNYSDTRKAYLKLGWTAKVPLEEGLRRTVDWFLDQQPTVLHRA